MSDQLTYFEYLSMCLEQYNHYWIDCCIPFDYFCYACDPNTPDYTEFKKIVNNVYDHFTNDLWTTMTDEEVLSYGHMINEDLKLLNDEKFDRFRRDSDDTISKSIIHDEISKKYNDLIIIFGRIKERFSKNNESKPFSEEQKKKIDKIINEINNFLIDNIE